MTHTALIIAAGGGTRLQENGNRTPKPLRRVAGIPLIERIILSAKKAGIHEFVIVVGYQKEKIIKAVDEKKLGVKITFVTNTDWQKANGISVLKAKKYLNKNFVLLMSDHIFDPKTLATLKNEPLGANGVLLAIDSKISSVYDLEDATKVMVRDENITGIGKDLKNFNAIDTGMFLASPALFDALEATMASGNCSLSDGIQYLAEKNKAGIFTIGPALWHDVDTEDALKQAEKQLFNACRKNTDGWIARNINRHISLFISKLLIKTGLSANHVTGFTTLVGILSGVFVARGDYWNVLLGAFLFQSASILDGCDGEISRVKMTNSKTGQWLDTISDNLTYIVFFAGVIIGVANRGTPGILITGPLTAFGVCMTMLVMFIYLFKHTNSGSLLAIQKDFYASRETGFWAGLGRRLSFMVKRDFFALLFFGLAIFNQLEGILWMLLIGSNVAWMVILTSLFKPAVVAVEKTKI